MACDTMAVLGIWGDDIGAGNQATIVAQPLLDKSVQTEPDVTSFQEEQGDLCEARQNTDS